MNAIVRNIGTGMAAIMLLWGCQTTDNNTGSKSTVPKKTLSFPATGPSEGDTFVYLDKKYNLRTTWVFASPGKYRRPQGAEVWLKNDDGNTISRQQIFFDPHSGSRPPGSRGKLRVGQSWTHRYKVNGVDRVRRCEVEEQRDFVTAAGLFPNALKIECENQRQDRNLPRYEEIWFAPNFDAELKFTAEWFGTDPGNFGYELVEVQRKK